MKRTRIRPLALAFYLSLSVIAMHAMAIESSAEDSLAVSIGGSTWSAKDAYSHDVSRKALEDGQREFMVSSSADKSYPIKLSDKQAEDILAGSTVVVNSENGDRKVKIGPMEKKAKTSGW